jgi:hypothetical protein
MDILNSIRLNNISCEGGSHRYEKKLEDYSIHWMFLSLL